MSKTNSTPVAPVVAPVLPDTIGTLKMDILGNGELQTVAVYPKKFSTGSLGWFTNGKAVLIIDGKAVPVTFQFQAVVIGSKPTA